jgi:hypothetical protein
MQRKPMKKFNPLPVHWVVADSVKVNGRFITPGTELRIAGERGRFKFERYVENGRVVRTRIVPADITFTGGNHGRG